jgi:hypothetical protein
MSDKSEKLDEKRVQLIESEKKSFAFENRNYRFPGTP